MVKNEDRLIELMAEALKRQDQHADILERHETLLKKLVDGQEKLVYEFHKMNDHLLTRQETMESRISRLEDKVFLS